MNQENPFLAPMISDDAIIEKVDRESRTYGVGETVVIWEKLRWAYNGILTVVSLFCLLIRPAWLSVPGSLAFMLLAGFVGANICYSAGTLVGAYLAWAGFQHRVLTTIMFTGGTLLAIVLTAWLIMTTTFP